MPVVIDRLNYVSILKYAIGALSVTNFKSSTFTCSSSQLLSDGTCPVTSGNLVLSLYNLDVNRNLYLVGVAICTILYRAIAFGVLYLKKKVL